MVLFHATDDDSVELEFAADGDEDLNQLQHQQWLLRRALSIWTGPRCEEWELVVPAAARRQEEKGVKSSRVVEI